MLYDDITDDLESLLIDNSQSSFDSDEYSLRLLLRREAPPSLLRQASPLKVLSSNALQRPRPNDDDTPWRRVTRKAEGKENASESAPAKFTNPKMMTTANRNFTSSEDPLDSLLGVKMDTTTTRTPTCRTDTTGLHFQDLKPLTLRPWLTELLPQPTSSFLDLMNDNAVPVTVRMLMPERGCLSAASEGAQLRGQQNLAENLVHQPSHRQELSFPSSNNNHDNNLHFSESETPLRSQQGLVTFQDFLKDMKTVVTQTQCKQVTNTEAVKWVERILPQYIDVQEHLRFTAEEFGWDPKVQTFDFQQKPFSVEHFHMKLQQRIVDGQRGWVDFADWTSRIAGSSAETVVGCSMQNETNFDSKLARDNCSTAKVDPGSITSATIEEAIAKLRPYFRMSIKKAAKQNGIGLTNLKKVCRKSGILRWPSRKFKSVQTFIDNLTREDHVTEEHAERRVRGLGLAANMINEMEQDPSIPLPSDFVRVRQRCFKFKYKKKISREDKSTRNVRKGTDEQQR
ncbi:hypothetical protein CYMTET_48864 [Cymbomonas tetramitiformis]|uniref:RWP-RK domain-containing protein n=1 Tax=Cymbomonas tetramitiformis TaxID=36881 RepID=A0AAE0EWD3_9CHLO|nr:hypothetical protein CYMTET_48864 [Cymbomonas tetramitiformis]